MKLLDKNKNEIHFGEKALIEAKIKTLEVLTKNNPTKDEERKLKSLLGSEIFTSLFIEGEVSSRRSIKKSFDDKEVFGTSKKSQYLMINDFLDAYSYAFKPRPFTLSNLFTLYSLVSRHGLKDEDKLLDGKMYRHDVVYINSNSIKDKAFQGFEQSEIKDALINLFKYLNDADDNLFLKAVVGHIYFEVIHPYFDFNGRTGRFLPMWLFANHNRLNEMMYFSTAMGNYRKQYISLFRKNIDPRTHQINMDKLVMGMLDLLILNQQQYIWIKKLENKYSDETNKSFTAIQKDFIWTLMIKSELSNAEGSWFKLTKEDKQFIESELKDPLFSKESIKLKNANIIKISSDKPRKYKLNDYKLFGK